MQAGDAPGDARAAHRGRLSPAEQFRTAAVAVPIVVFWWLAVRWFTTRAWPVSVALVLAPAALVWFRGPKVGIDRRTASLFLAPSCAGSPPGTAATSS